MPNTQADRFVSLLTSLWYVLVFKSYKSLELKFQEYKRETDNTSWPTYHFKGHLKSNVLISSTKTEDTQLYSKVNKKSLKMKTFRYSLQNILKYSFILANIFENGWLLEVHSKFIVFFLKPLLNSQWSTAEKMPKKQKNPWSLQQNRFRLYIEDN